MRNVEQQGSVPEFHDLFAASFIGAIEKVFPDICAGFQLEMSDKVKSVLTFDFSMRKTKSKAFVITEVQLTKEAEDRISELVGSTLCDGHGDIVHKFFWDRKRKALCVILQDIS